MANHNPGDFHDGREKAAEAGHDGGQESSGSLNNDPKRVSEAGHKGGKIQGN